MTTFAIEYQYNPTSEKILEHRPKHREFLANLLKEGKLLASGPITEPAGSSLIIIRLAEGATIADAKAEMEKDPFHQEGALDARTFQVWDPVLNVFQA